MSANNDIQRLAAAVATNYLIWRRDRHARRGPTLQRERAEAAFHSKLKGTVAQVAEYADVELQDAAREQIPVDRLHDEANAAVEKDPGSRFHDNLVKSLLRWFKNEYFTWTNNPACSHCATSATTTPLGAVSPSPDESAFRCSRTELFKCSSCHRETRFPRYNDPRKLMTTRRGRCGEYANVFTLFCTAMGFETRYILDFTDHVWTEVYCDGVGWINCDSCEGEGSYGTPLMYEAGWGKKLTYVFAFGPYEAVDVIKRYTNNIDDVRSRRTDVDEGWLRKTLAEITAQLRRDLPESVRLELERRDAQERAQLDGSNKPVAVENLHGRESGSLAWRAVRGELGSNPDGETKSETALPAIADDEKDPKPDASA
ncbi:hypothetical protein HDU88_006785 [Geranomyces variabilis]|nr:hypothetical protein HDU88_006785 [Geranomyces variabilis]